MAPFLAERQRPKPKPPKPKPEPKPQPGPEQPIHMAQFVGPSD